MEEKSRQVTGWPRREWSTSRRPLTPGLSVLNRCTATAEAKGLAIRQHGRDRLATGLAEWIVNIAGFLPDEFRDKSEATVNSGRVHDQQDSGEAPCLFLHSD